MKKKYRVKIAAEECKGCGRCILACRKGVLVAGIHLNAMGYPAAEVTDAVCVGCSLCFYSCPEPGAITIFGEDTDDTE